MEVKELKLSEIKPYKNNPRDNTAAVEPVMQSIKQFGFKVPIIIDKNNEIVTGHTRYKAAKKLKLKTVPCILADDLSDEQIKAFRIADNKVSEFAKWDFDLLETELAALKELEYDMSGFGFEDLEVVPEEPEKDVEEDNYDPDKEVPTRTKRGQIWQLGNHRLMVGDSTDTEDVKKLMNGELADCVITDPPYNVAISNSDGLTIANDDMDDAAFQTFLESAFSNLNMSLKAGGAFYIWYASSTALEFLNALKENNLQVREQLIWNKNSFVFGRSDYHWKHEPCLYGWKAGEAHYFVDCRSYTTVIDEEIPDVDSMKKEEMKILLKRILSTADVPTTVIDEAKPQHNDLHPTMKPLRLIDHLAKNSTKKGNLILDLFGGSGSTLMVAEQTDRICYMMEYDPIYADKIIDRWESYTMKKAKLLEEVKDGSKGH